jgi:DNA mismatch repair protein MLH3
MALRPPSIRPLPPESQAQITSSVIITSLNDAIIGLLENVLDAGATRAEIHLDYVRGYCSVTDNGSGIPATEFRPDGHLGSLHCTSRLDTSRPTYGRYGRFLHHLGGLSILSITSKCGHLVSTITFHRANIIARSEEDNKLAESIRGEHGTHVVVANLFGDIPVRYQYNAARLETVSLAEVEWAILKRRITALILACGRAIDIKVQVCDAKRKRTCKYRVDALQRRTSFELATICSALQQAGYIDNSQAASFKLISLQTPSIRVRAAVSLHSAPKKDVQFISIGIRPVSTSSAMSLFQDEINKTFELSSFGDAEDDVDRSEDEQERRRKLRRSASDSHTNHQLRGHKKGVDRWPMFYVRIDSEDARSSTALDSQTTEAGITEQWLERILDLLRSIFYEFLSIHHFRPRARKKKRLEKINLNSITNAESPSPPANCLELSSREPALRAASGPLVPRYFDGWSRVKTGATIGRPTRVSSKFENRKDLKVTDYPTPRQQTPAERVQLAQNTLGEIELQALDDKELELLVDDYHDEVQLDRGAQTLSTNEDHARNSDGSFAWIRDEEEAAYLWTDPVTGIEHKINARNGFVRPNVEDPHTRSSMAVNAALPERPATAPAMVSITQRFRAKPAKKSPAELIASLQQSDLIRSFHPPEERITSIVPELDDIATAQQSHSCFQLHRRTSEYFSMPNNMQSYNVGKADLQSAEILAQVDQKFILLQTRPSNNSEPLLVMIDQHAADERVKVEELYTKLCTGETTTLATPIIFEVPNKEFELFIRHQKHFEEWQLIYKVKQKGSEKGLMKQIVMSALPSLISERCRLDPKLLIDLLRREVHHASPSPSSTASSSEWIHRMPHCPTGLVEMVNSRACRSAIMFNDVLDNTQCEELVRKLAECTLPFQCAHGRPSCVVLPRWSGSDRISKDEMGFAEKFRKWKNCPTDL